MDTVRVVVADDNIQLRDMVAEYLQEQNGIEVVGTAGDGVETLRLVTECEPDVLVCDLIMPQMDGYAVLERLQAMKLSKQPGVIALTALGRDDFISRAVNLGVNYYMVKPFDFMMLAQRVYEAAGESLRAEAISAKMIKQQGGKTGGETLEERIANLFLTVGIPVAWNRGRIDALDEAFGKNVCALDDKPTNGEFIALVADRLGAGKSA